MAVYIQAVEQVVDHATRHVDGGADEIISALDIRALAKSLYYGVSWDESADTYTRTGTLASVATGSSPSDSLIPIQAAMRRCLLSDSGVVQYYLDPSDSTKKVGGAASVLTGADGQVMVQIPKFYHYYGYSGTTHTHNISLYPLAGFSIHPAFVKNGVIVDYRYIAAYEGVLYDTTESDYVNGLYIPASASYLFTFTAVDDKILAVAGTGSALSHPFTNMEVGEKLVISGTTAGANDGTFTVATKGDNFVTVSEALADQADDQCIIQTQRDWTATTGDVLSSVSGKLPMNYGTRAEFRAVAKNRGTGWRQQDYDLISAIHLLYLTEYASWDSQSMIGNGLTDWASGWPAWNNYNPIETTGNSNSNGNATANTSGGDATVGSYMSYRGIENFFGHLWKWVDGMNIHNYDDDAGTNYSRVYISNIDTQFADNTATNYQAIADICEADGYIATLEQIPRGFLPASIGASSSTKITDYFYTYYDDLGAAPFDDWRVAALGGNASAGLTAGVAGWHVDDSSGGRRRHLGGRLTF